MSLLLLFLCCSGTKNWSGGGSRLLYCSTPASLDFYSNWIFRFTLIQLYYFRHGCPSFNEKETAAHSHQHRNNPPGPALARWLTESTTTLSTSELHLTYFKQPTFISIKNLNCGPGMQTTDSYIVHSSTTAGWGRGVFLCESRVWIAADAVCDSLLTLEDGWRDD